MTDPDIPLPAGGGSWTRHKDGTLTRDEEPTAVAAVAAEAPLEEGVKPAPKRPVKEA